MRVNDETVESDISMYAHKAQPVEVPPSYLVDLLLDLQGDRGLIARIYGMALAPYDAAYDLQQDIIAEIEGAE